jgi:uncharacterized protein YeaO (DUF488 family)
MPRTDLENLEKRRWASKFWREITPAKELRDLMRHELLKPAEWRCYNRQLLEEDEEQLARSVTALRSLLIIREREQKAFQTAYPLTTRLRAAA